MKHSNQPARIAILAAVPLLLLIPLWQKAQQYQTRVKTQALFKAVRRPYPSVSEVQRLLAAGADVKARDKDGCGILSYAALQTPALVELLLKQGAEVNAISPNCDAGPPLTSAIIAHQPATVQLLLQHGADIRLKNREGSTAGVLAAVFSTGAESEAEGRQYQEIKRLLLRAGARESDFQMPQN